MDKLILDTNGFLRFLLNDIPKQSEEVSKLLTKAKSKKIEIFVPQIVIFEIEFALDKYYKFPKIEIIDKLSVLLSTSYLKIQDVNVFQETLILFSDKNVDFVDCFLMCYAKSKNTTLFTFDKNLKKLEN
jgi:predicted nucleic-acid-binding protein